MSSWPELEITWAACFTVNDSWPGKHVGNYLLQRTMLDCGIGVLPGLEGKIGQQGGLTMWSLGWSFPQGRPIDCEPRW